MQEYITRAEVLTPPRSRVTRQFRWWLLHQFWHNFECQNNVRAIIPTREQAKMVWKLRFDLIIFLCLIFMMKVLRWIVRFCLSGGMGNFVQTRNNYNRELLAKSPRDEWFIVDVCMHAKLPLKLIKSATCNQDLSVTLHFSLFMIHAQRPLKLFFKSA